MSVTLYDNVPPDTPGAPDFSITNVVPTTPPAPVPAAAPLASNKKWLRSWNLTVGTPGPGLSVGGQAVVGIVGQENVNEATRSAGHKNVATQGGAGLDLSDYHIEFEVEQVLTQMPWRLHAKIYNVPVDLSNKIAEQYTTVSLIAGYRLPQPKQSASTPLPSPTREEIANLPPVATLPQGYKPGGSLLFDGQIVWFERGRDNATDTFLKIYANSFDIAHNQAMINTTLPKGSTQRDVVQACVDAMAKDNPGIKVGFMTPGMDDMKSPRARTLYGMPREILRDVAQSIGAQCIIDAQGKVNIVKLTDDIVTTAAPNAPSIFVFNTLTGMVGVPTQNMDGGMSARCLLNPAIGPFSQIKLALDNVTRKTFSNTPVPGGGGLAPEVQAVSFQQSMNAPNGIYKVWSAKHTGDNRGTPWYTDVITWSANPASQAPKLG